MKYIRQFNWILCISFLGEVLRYIIPLPVPASIYGLILMILALKTGVLKLDSVQTTSRYLIDIMPLAFIPACVGLMTAWGQLKTIVFPVIVISCVSTILVMGITGRVTQAVIRGGKRKKNDVQL